MDRAKKSGLVQDLHQRVNGSSVVIVVHYRGLSVAELTELRNRLYECGASLQVVKNTLMNLALKDTDYSDSLKGKLKGPSAVIISQDPVSAAKVVSEFAKANEKISVIGGALQTAGLNAQQVHDLAKLPSLDELRAKLLGLINAPARNIAGVIHSAVGSLARVTGAYSRTGE